MKTLQERFEEKIFYSPDGCWYWTGSLNNMGYGWFGVNRKIKLAHRVSYSLYRSSIPEGMILMHACDNPACVNPDHLKLGTMKQNTQDMISKGRTNGPKGTRNSKCRITEEQARFIKNQISLGVRPCDIYNSMKISKEIVRGILYRNTWSYLSMLLFTVMVILSSCTEEVIKIQKEIVTDTVKVTEFIDRYYSGVDTVTITQIVEIPAPTRSDTDTVVVYVTDTLYLQRIDTVWRTQVVVERDTIMIRELTYGDTIMVTYGRAFFQVPDELLQQYFSFFESAAENGHEVYTGGNIWVEYSDLGDAQGMSYTAYGQKFLKLSGKLTTDQSYIPLMREMSRLYLGTQYSADPENLKYPFYSTSEIRYSNRNAHKEKLKELF